MVLMFTLMKPEERKLTRIIFSVCFILSVSVCSEAAEPVIFHIDAKGKTGWEIGLALGHSIKAEFPDIERKIDSYLAFYTNQYDFNQIFLKRLRIIKSNINLEHKEEVDAAGSCFATSKADRLGDGQLSLNEFWFFQLITDVGRRTNCSGFGVFGLFTVSGQPIVGRNMDWPVNRDLRSIQAITVYEYEKNMLVNIGFAGYLGVITGFNSSGLFAAYLSSPMRLAYPDPPEGRYSTAFDIRKALESGSRIPEVLKMMCHLYPFSYNLLLADKADVRVLEQPEGSYGKLRTASSQLRRNLIWGRSNQIAVVNCFALYGHSNTIGSADFARWYRFRELARFNSTDKQADVPDVMKIMTETPHQIFNKTTLQSMVFTPGDCKLYLYTAPVSGIHEKHPVMKEVRMLPKFKKTAYKVQPANMLIMLIAVLLGVTLFCFYQWPLPRRKH